MPEFSKGQRKRLVALVKELEEAAEPMRARPELYSLVADMDQARQSLNLHLWTAQLATDPMGGQLGERMGKVAAGILTNEQRKQLAGLIVGATNLLRMVWRTIENKDLNLWDNNLWVKNEPTSLIRELEEVAEPLRRHPEARPLVEFIDLEITALRELAEGVDRAQGWDISQLTDDPGDGKEEGNKDAD